MMEGENGCIGYGVTANIAASQTDRGSSGFDSPYPKECIGTLFCGVRFTPRKSYYYYSLFFQGDFDSLVIWSIWGFIFDPLSFTSAAMQSWTLSFQKQSRSMDAGLLNIKWMDVVWGSVGPVKHQK